MRPVQSKEPMQPNEKRIEKTREDRLRRYLRGLGSFGNHGYILKKSRVRIPTSENQGGYRILDDFFFIIEAGLNFELSLDDVEEFYVERGLERIREQDGWCAAWLMNET